jgi:hypothetical protein
MFEALAKVIAPDYTYWNPVPGTVASSEVLARAHAQSYANKTWPNEPYRRERFMTEIKIQECPLHRVPLA